MGVESLEVRLESNPDKVFHPGQDVVGVAVVNVKGSEGIEPRSIKVRFCGKCKVKFAIREDDETTWYWGEETFFDQKTVVFPPPGQTAYRLSPGSYTYPFGFKLPESLPSSFKHTDGKICYYVGVDVDLPRALDKKKKSYFTVVGVVDLNRTPGLAEPVGQEVSKTFHTGLVKRGEVLATVSLNKTGFVPGEEIKISADVQNKSKVEITELRAALVQNLKFVGESNIGEEEERLDEQKLEEIVTSESLGKDESTSWSNRALKVPAVPSWNPELCKNIFVNYCLQFIVVPKGLHMKLRVNIPLTIGTVPLRQQFDLPSYLQVSPSAPSMSLGALYPALPSSSYVDNDGGGEAKSGGKSKGKKDNSSSSSSSSDDSDDGGKKRFKPKYPSWMRK